MKKILIASLLSFALVVQGTAALAGGQGHRGHGGHGGYGYKGYGYGGHDYGDEILIGAGIIGGSILLGSLLSRPYNYQPAPTYYRPAPTCRTAASRPVSALAATKPDPAGGLSTRRFFRQASVDVLVWRVVRSPWPFAERGGCPGRSPRIMG